MTDKTPLEQILCLKFCTYYKPGKNEELACRGYMVVERLLREGKSIDLDRTSGESSRIPTDRIVNALCLACDFQKQDCDFMLDRAARPCGGFVLLAQLLGTGVITIEDIR
jgi:hypothetical protein